MFELSAILGLSTLVLIFVAIHEIRKNIKSEIEEQNTKETLNEEIKDINIASRPSSDANSLLKRMREDHSN